MREHFGYLDGWRGLAILLVLIEHFAPEMHWFAGRFGVDLFFVLSGLLMSQILYERRTPLPTFYRRRISRILPVFLLFVPVAYVIGALMPTPFTMTEFWATLTFTRAYIPGASPWATHVPVEHLWSLYVEEHCYMLLALLAVLVRKKEGLVLIALAFLTLAIRELELKRHFPEGYDLRTEVAATCILLSAGYRQFARRFAHHIRGWMPVLALLLAAPCYLWDEYVWWWLDAFVAPFLLAFAVNHINVSKVAVKFLSWKPLQLAGVLSYSIYIWQQPFNTFKDVIPGGRLVAVVGALLAGIASFYLFERPIRTWLNERWHGAGAPAQTEPT